MGLVCTYMGCSQNYGPLVVIDYLGGLQEVILRIFRMGLLLIRALKT